MSDEMRAVFERRGIRRVKVGGFDIDGILRGKYISTDKLFGALESGFGFCDVIFGWDVDDQLYDDAEVTGWHSGYPDALAKIDQGSLRVLPSEPHVAHFLVDFHDKTGKPHPACPRNLLKRVAARAESAGYRAKFGAEFEFWIFRETPESVREKGYRDLQPITPGMFGYSWLREGQQRALLHDIMDTLDEYDVPIEGLHTETGPGVYEAALAPSPVVEAADRAALFKTTVKEICHRHGLAVTFMAKWHPELPGSSGHLHQSLLDSTGETNLMADANGALSELGKRYVAGLVAHAPALTAAFAPFINSYRRYVPGMWAPLTAAWGFENRTCGVRVIEGSQKSTRVELRQTAADINPYIAMAASLGAGLHGIEHGLEPPAPIEGDATGDGVPGAPLPTTLADAVRVMRESEAARQILGDAFVNHYTTTRMWEVREAQKAVTDWEIRRYFEAV